MPKMPKQIWMNGELLSPEKACVSVYDHGLLYGDGVFEGIRAYNGRIFKLATHLRRLWESAQAIRLAIPYSVEVLAKAVRQTVEANDCLNGYIRLCVTRGVGTLGLNPLLCKDPTVFIIADTITLYPQELYEKGMSVITAATIRNHPAALSPRIKSMNYLNNIMAKLEALDAGLVEAVMLNHQGYVAECTGDNLFIVKNHAATIGTHSSSMDHSDSDPGPNAADKPETRMGTKAVLITPPLSAGVLEGVTRNEVIRLAFEEDIRFQEADLTRHDLYTADEMFLTGTAAEIIPVTGVDGRIIGNGKPGPVTDALTHAFHDMVRHDAPED